MTQATVVLDACVLYPAPIRDLLLNLADFDFFNPKWTEAIQREWVTNLSRNRPDLTQEQLEKTIMAMNAAFPDANIIGYESLIDSVELPDQKDRHVVAAAIQSKANIVVTANIRDFPKETPTQVLKNIT